MYLAVSVNDAEKQVALKIEKPNVRNEMIKLERAVLRDYQCELLWNRC